MRKFMVHLPDKLHEEVYGPPPRQTRRRRQPNKRRPARRPSPAPVPTPVSPIMFDETTSPTHNPPLNTTSFYFEDLIAQNFSWQNIPYEMTFPSPGSDDSQAQFNTIYHHQPM